MIYVTNIYHATGWLSPWRFYGKNRSISYLRTLTRQVSYLDALVLCIVYISNATFLTSNLLGCLKLDGSDLLENNSDTNADRTKHIAVETDRCIRFLGGCLL